jgi:hypothetical protein
LWRYSIGSPGVRRKEENNRGRKSSLGEQIYSFDAPAEVCLGRAPNASTKRLMLFIKSPSVVDDNETTTLSHEPVETNKADK